MVYVRRTFLRRYAFVKTIRSHHTSEELFLIFDGDYHVIWRFAEAIKQENKVDIVDTYDLKLLIDYLREKFHRTL